MARDHSEFGRALGRGGLPQCHVIIRTVTGHVPLLCNGRMQEPHVTPNGRIWVVSFKRPLEFAPKGARCFDLVNITSLEVPFLWIELVHIILLFGRCFDSFG